MAAAAGQAPTLPPLTQPTGELPRLPAVDQDVAVPDHPGGGRSLSEGRLATEPSPDEALSALSDPRSRQRPVEPPPADRDGLETEGGPGELGFGAGAFDLGPTGTADPAPTEALPGIPQTDELASRGPAAARRFDPAAEGVPARPGSLPDEVGAFPGRPMSGQLPLDDPTDIGRPMGGSTGPSRGFATDPTERLQDTEFKLAGQRRKPKPKEPNRLILAVAMAVVVLVGVGVAWFLTRGDDGSDTAAFDDAGDVTATDDAGTEDLAAADPDAGSQSELEPQVDEPTLLFEQAQVGPLVQGTTYSIDLVGEPTGSMLQVVVDDIPQGTPDTLLPDLILPAGRHSLYIEITNGTDVTASTPVEVYVLGDLPPEGFRANLSSVDIQNEGWAEAIRRFDEFRAAGHDGLQLAPLSDGYWNIFVGDLGADRAAAQSYCDSFGLAVPDECFPIYFDPAEAPPGAAGGAATGPEPEAMTEGDGTDESMTDENGDTTTTTAGG